MGMVDPPDRSDRSARDRLSALGTDIQAAYDAGQKALKAVDFAAYGTAQKDLDNAIQRAVAAAPKGGSVTVTPTPSTTTTTPTPTTTTTP